MQGRSVLCALAVVGSLAGCATTAHQVARSEWHELRTARFRLWTNGDPERAQLLVADLERLHQVLRKTTSGKEHEASPPVRIVLAADRASYKALTGAHWRAVGSTRFTTRGTYAFVNAQASAVGSDDVSARLVLFAAYARAFLAQQEARLPHWYVTGFSEYMSTTRFEEGDAYTVGCAPLHRMGYFADSRWIPIGDLFRDYQLVKGRTALPRSSVVDTQVESWYAFHYFAADAQRQRALRRYLELWSTGLDSDAAIEGAFGMTPRQIDGEIRAYAGRDSFQCLLTQPQPLPVPAIERRPLSQAEAALHTGDAMLSVVGATDGAIALLEEAAASGRDGAAARALARAHLMRAESGQSDRTAELHLAQQLLLQAEALEPDSAEGLTLEGHRLVAQVELMRAGDASAGADEVARARRLYRKAIRADETMAEAYYGLGVTYLLEDNGTSEEPIAALEAAAFLLPHSDEVAFVLGEIELRRGRVERARPALEYAARIAPDGRRERALAELERLQALERPAAAPPAAPATPALPSAPATVVAPTPQR